MPNAFAAADYVSSSATILSGAPSTDSLLMPLHPHPPTKSLSALATDFLVCVEQSFPQLSSVGFQSYGLDWPCRMRRKTYRKYPWSLNIDIFSGPISYRCCCSNKAMGAAVFRFRG